MSSPAYSAISITRSDLIQQLQLSLGIPEIVQAIQRRHIVFASAKAAGLEVDALGLQAAADRFRLQHNLLGANQTWTWLSRYQLSLDELELRLHEEILTQRLAEHLFVDQVESTFAERYLEDCQVALYEIVLDNFDFALELFDALQAKEVTFAGLAQDYAATPGLRRRGGYLGHRRRAELSPEIAAAAFAADPPQLLRPVQRQGRSHLLYVEARREPELDAPRRAEILQQLFEAWMNQAIAQMEVTLAIE